MEYFITNIITPAGVAGLLIWLSREWISTRLKGSIQHEYDQKLEAHKAQLKAENEVARLELKATIEREAALHAVAHASFSEGQKAAMERKLNAIDSLWGKVLQLRGSLTSGLTVIDALTVDEYKNIKNIPSFQKLVKSPEENIAAIMSDKDGPIEKVRPYVGEHIWTLFCAYQAIMLRRLFLFHLEHDDAAKIEWHKNAGVRQLIEAVLTTEELKAFDQIPFNKGSWLQGLLESKILAPSQKVISGEEFGAKSLEQAKLIQQHAEQLNSEFKTDYRKDIEKIRKGERP